MAKTLGPLLSVFIAFPALAQKPVNWEEQPEPYATPSAINPPRVVSRPPGVELKLPAGFQVEEYMTGFQAPRFMLLGPNQEVLLTDMGEGAVYAIKGNSRKKLITGLEEPYGLALHEDWLYVAESTSVKRYKYDSNALTVPGKGEEIISLQGLGSGHVTRTILFDRAHKKLYLSVGSQSNVSLGEPPMRAAVSRFNPDGSGQEIFASGLRNAVGLRWYPDTDVLWVTVHERDGLGDDLVPDYLARVNQGDFFGWPYAYIGPHEDPRHKGVAPDKVKATRYPDVLLGSHVGALDLLFYTGEQFPEEYRGGCLVALHGSWNRSKRVGYKLVFIPFKDGRPRSGSRDFLTGWMLSPDSREIWGRPVGLLQLPDGSILVSDDGGGKIWRVSYGNR